MTAPCKGRDTCGKCTCLHDEEYAATTNGPGASVEADPSLLGKPQKAPSRPPRTKAWVFPAMALALSLILFIFLLGAR